MLFFARSKHSLKVLDRVDIKVIPPKYVLNRWTQVAKEDTIVVVEVRRVIEDVMLDVKNHNGDLIHELTPTYAKATHNEEQTQFLPNELSLVREKYEVKFENLSRISGEVNPTSNISQHSLHLKKKNGGDRCSK
jgi:hypothetical protein